MNTLAKVKNVERIYISSKEARAYLGMSKDFFDSLRKSGELPYYQLGGKAIFYKLADINAVMERHRVNV